MDEYLEVQSSSLNLFYINLNNLQLDFNIFFILNNFRNPFMITLTYLLETFSLSFFNELLTTADNKFKLIYANTAA